MLFFSLQPLLMDGNSGNPNVGTTQLWFSIGELPSSNNQQYLVTIKNKELVNYNPTISQPATKIMEPWGTKIEPISD
jgi:hypothetical protein